MALLHQLTAVLEAGRRTSTYKLAVLLALIDCAAAGTDCAGTPASRIATRAIARRVVELYWPQVEPWTLHGGNPAVLRQSTGVSAVTMREVIALVTAARAVKARTLAQAEADKRSAAEVERALGAIELNLVHMPLGRLQRPRQWKTGQHYYRFLYDDTAFRPTVSPRMLERAPLFVQLEPGVAEALVATSGLLRPLVELHWANDVRRRNPSLVEDDRLHDFLFGSRRRVLRSLVPALQDLDDRCFYCRGPLNSRVEVDHFLPWSRIPNDSLANLVLAHPRCNGSKQDSLAATEHLGRWINRPWGQLLKVQETLGWPADIDRCKASVRAAYLHAATGTRLWRSPTESEPLNRAEIRAVLGVPGL